VSEHPPRPATGSSDDAPVDVPGGEPVPDDTPASDDPAALLALIAAQRENTRRRTSPTMAVIGTAWGVAWLLGYLVLYLTFDGVSSPWWAFLAFASLLVLAMVVTAVHTARRVSGLGGDSATVGTMYGWSWIIGFIAAALIFASAARAGAGPEIMAILSNAVSALVVGLLYLAGGMLWREGRMFALGAWIALVAGLASLAGPPTTYLVMALAGGGGFLVAAVVDAVVSRRRSS